MPQLYTILTLNQGIIDPTGTETFAKEPKVRKIISEAKVDACAVSLKKSIGFSCMSVTASFCVLVALLRDNF